MWNPLICELFVIYIGMNICEFEFKRTFSLVFLHVTPPQSKFFVYVPVDVVCPVLTVGIKSKIA